MKKYGLWVVAALIVVSLFTACSEPEVEWEMVWNDEFEYSGLPDSTKWNFETRGNSYGWGNNEAQWYTERELKNAWVDNGILHIAARKELICSKNYSSARLSTRNKGDWKYGRLEIRAQLPGGIGTWPAIWMLSTENRYGGWPHSGEIDIMEHVGYQPDSVFSTVHTGKFNHVKGTQVGKTLYLPTATKKFHTYALDWDTESLRSYVDGKLYFTFTNNGDGSESWPFDEKFHLILNVAVGGGLGGKQGIDDTIFPREMLVDYVRVYRKK